MITTDPNVSPVIDLDRVNVCLTTNRINSPVSNFATDPNVRITGQDPCASTYVSKLIVLENPASEITVNFAAYRRNSSDIRVFFKTISEGSTENSMNVNFTPFPGTGNFTQGGTVRNSSASNGLPDALTTASTDFGYKDYEFTTGSIPRFTKFQIKIDMVGTNQAEPPYIKDLRAIALA